MNISLSNRYLPLIYALVGSLVLTAMPLLAMLELHSGPLFTSFLSYLLLVVLVAAILWISLYINLRCYHSSFAAILLINVAAYLVLTTLSIAIHMPLWKYNLPGMVHFYIRDEIVRNITVFGVSFLASRIVMKEKEERQKQERVAQLEKENLNSQIRGLTQQINPHFLFNSLNTLSGIVRENPEKSELFIEKLSQVYRYVLSAQDHSLVTIEEELRFMQDYILLLQIRFEDKLSVELENHVSGDELVVPLCTQLLIENVIKHNAISRYANMLIHIDVTPESLTVTNSYHPKKILPQQKHLGLKNLDARCRLLVNHPISVTHNDKIFSVRVPLTKKGNINT